MENLFAYGTLMCEDIMQAVTGYRRPGTWGVLRGYSRHPVKGERYPGLVNNATGLVEGVVYRNVPASAWGCLDRFEGDMYERHSVKIDLPDGVVVPALCYVVQTQFVGRLEESDWDFDEFIRSGKSEFIKNYRGYMAL